MEEIFNEFGEFLNKSPENAYLFGAIILFIFSIGNFKKWDWAVSPSGHRQTYWYNILGKKYFSKIMGVIFLIGSMACFFLFLFN